MEKASITPDAISTILANPSPESSSEVPELIVQVVDLKPVCNRYTFMASDGKMKVKAILPSNLSSEIESGNIQNLGLIRILDYTVNAIPNMSEKYLIATKCKVVSPALGIEVKSELKKEESGIFLKPKQEMFAKSAAQILHEQHCKY